MMKFVPPKRKLIELIILPVSGVILFSFTTSIDTVILFVLGFIWNWSASNDLVAMFENKRYRFSLLKMVYNIQQWVIRPFKIMPEVIQRVVASLPAATFLYIIIFLNKSAIPWWPTLLGSFIFEMIQFEIKVLEAYKSRKGLP